MHNRLSIYIVFFFICFFLSCSYKGSDKIRIGFSQCTSNADWRKSMNYSMKVQASVYSNVDLSIYDGQDDPQNQIADVEEMIKSEMDIIIISPLEPELIVDVVDKAMASGIPVILLDRKINSNNFTAYLGADNIEVGRNAGNYIVSSPNENINIIEVKGGDSSTPVSERSLGFHQIINSNSRAHLLKSLEGVNAGLPIELFGKVLDSLGGETIDYAYFFNDEMAIDAWKVAKEKGIENDIKFIGVDGLNGPDGGIKMVQDGKLDATLFYPTGGAEVIKLALQILNGETVPKNTLLTTTVIDKFNADIMQDQLNRVNQQQTEIENQVITISEKEELYASQNVLLKASLAFLIIILSLTIYAIYSVIAIRKKNRQLEITNAKITIQRNQIEKIANQVKVSNEAKLNFFTGLSHEFKTPITLILSSIESIGDLIKDKGSKLGYEVELIYNNSNRLLRLINQLLDFRKSEEQKFQLKASKTNIYTFSQKIFNDFKREAKKRNIDFALESQNKELNVFIDRNLMDKVYFNLLSNAFKFTPDNGKIRIKIIENVNNVIITFKDSGIGIPEKEIVNVFKPFFKGSNNRKNSSGIGLHLSKDFIELHKGKIEVGSLKGAEFAISLQKGSDHLSDKEIIEEQDIIGSDIIDFSIDYADSASYLIQDSDIDVEKYSVLIIEDNRDLSIFLKNKLISEYNIYLSDGSDAVDKAFDNIPDIVICDINLPDKDGFEICKILKKDLRTSHIPTIILTAMGDKESYLKGLESGADLYLTKPFSYSILIQSVKSLLYNRENLRYYYTNNIHKIEELDSFGNLEQVFMSKINNIIEENIDQSDFSVEELSQLLNISRVQLYRKVKALLGMSVSEYINSIRLNKAKIFLKESSQNISEIAYSVGFSSPGYFSTSFKNKYGVTPHNYRNNK